MAADGRLAGRIALVTGASRGIGAAVARRFAAEGARLVALARTEGGLTELDDAVRRLPSASGGKDGKSGESGEGRATLVVLDLTRPDDIERAAAALYQRFGRLDILVSAAGELGVLSPASHIDPARWQATMALNAGAAQRLIRACEPLLKCSDAGRAIFVTCDAGRTPKAFWSLYAASKAALESLVLCWADELGPTAIRANLIDPGPVATGLHRQAFPGIPAAELRPPDDPVLGEAFVALAEAGCRQQGQRVVLPPFAAGLTET